MNYTVELKDQLNVKTKLVVISDRVDNNRVNFTFFKDGNEYLVFTMSKADLNTMGNLFSRHNL